MYELKLSWVSFTALGAPVVPEVKRRRAVSVSEAEGKWASWVVAEEMRSSKKSQL